jgi:hypothetical protein
VRQSKARRGAGRRALIDEPADRWVVVTGGLRMANSALLAAWLALREAGCETCRITSSVGRARPGRSGEAGGPERRGGRIDVLARTTETGDGHACSSEFRT